MENGRPIGIGGTKSGPALVGRPRQRASAPRHLKMPVLGIHEAGNAEHPKDGVDGAVVLADEGQLVDSAEHNGRRALINRVVGQKKRQWDAVRCGWIFAVPLARVIEAHDTDAPVL